MSWIDELLRRQPKNEYGLRPPCTVFPWRSILCFDCIGAKRYSPELRKQIAEILDRLEEKIKLERVSGFVMPSLQVWIRKGVTQGIITQEEVSVVSSLWIHEIEHSRTPLADILDSLA